MFNIFKRKPKEQPKPTVTERAFRPLPRSVPTRPATSSSSYDSSSDVALTSAMLDTYTPSYSESRSSYSDSSSSYSSSSDCSSSSDSSSSCSSGD